MNKKGALGAAPGSVMCRTAPVFAPPGRGPFGQAPNSAVPGAVLREQLGSQCTAFVLRLSAKLLPALASPFPGAGDKNDPPVSH